MIDIPTFSRANKIPGRPFDKPAYTIDFGEHESWTTSEVLRIFGISYSALASRRDRNGFPQPTIKGVNGKTAMYEREALERWCLTHGFRVKRNGVLL